MNLGGLRVAFDREIFLLQEFGGVSNAFARLIYEFGSDTSLGVQPEFTFSISNNYHLMQVDTAKQNLRYSKRFFFQPKSGLETLLTLGPIRQLNSLWAGGAVPERKSDIFHATYYRPTVPERLKGRKLAITVHDFIPEKLGWSGVRNPHIGKRKLCLKSDLIVCVSNETANELQEMYKVGSDRVSVVPHGCSPVSSSFPRKDDPDTFQILYVGQRGGYKKFPVLVDALHLLSSQKFEFKLVVAGSSLSDSEIKNLNAKIGSDNWVFELTPTDDRLIDLYDQSTIHCVTSELEGFGMTILESMARGTPVVATDIPVFHEVGGASMQYFSKGNAESLAVEISKFTDTSYRKNQAAKALGHAQMHTWKASANKLAEAYKKVGNR
jgi:glycosyltransferase involved in cell wall biosynthesis